MILWLLACGNTPPELLSVNGDAYVYDRFGGRVLPNFDLEPGTSVPLKLQVRDREGHRIEIHFADMPGIVDFDPTGTIGTLHVFELSMDTGYRGPRDGLILLMDDGTPPAMSEHEFLYDLPRDDSGLTDGGTYSAD